MSAEVHRGFPSPQSSMWGLHGKGHRNFSYSSSPPNKAKASIQRVTAVVTQEVDVARIKNYTLRALWDSAREGFNGLNVSPKVRPRNGLA